MRFYSPLGPLWAFAKSEDFYLLEMALPAISRIQGEGVLFQAQSLSDILAIASERLLPPESKVWCLLWPGLPDHSMMVTTDGQDSVDDSLSVEMSQMKLPMENRVFTSGKWHSWDGTRLVTALSSQFDWAKSAVVLAPIRGGYSHVGILGISGTISAAEAKDAAGLLSVAIGNLARVQGLHRETAAYQFLLSCHQESLLVVGESGRIVGATQAGTESLNMVEFGDRRSPLKEASLKIPQKILSEVLHGEPIAARGISILATPFRGERFDLVEPMIVVEIRLVDNLAPDRSGFEPGKVLTPAQKEVYSLVIRGLDYKEIAKARSISPHTVHRHVVEILRRLKCRDRLKLISQAIR